MIKSAWFFPDNITLADIPANYPGLQQGSFEFLRFRKSKFGPEGASLADSHVYQMAHEWFGGLVYSAENAKFIKQNIPEPYVTVSGRHESGVAEMLADPAEMKCAVDAIVDFTKSIGFVGVDLNIEGVVRFTRSEASKYVAWLEMLANALRARGLKFRFVTHSESLERPPHFTNESISHLISKIDYILPMCYDAQYTLGKSEICPVGFAEKTIEQLLDQGWPAYKIIAGVANYGYTAHRDNVWDVKIVYPREARPLLPEPPVTRTQSEEIYNELPDGRYMYYRDGYSLTSQVYDLVQGYGIAGFSMWAAQDDGDWFDEELYDEFDMDDEMEECAMCRFRTAGHEFIDAMVDVLRWV